MSLLHITLEKTVENDQFVKYNILCPDFNDSLEMEYLGFIEIDKKIKTFSHKDNELWLKNKIYPINLFKLSVDERKKIIEKNYKGYGGGMWGFQIFDFIKTCIKNNEYPNKKSLIA